MPAKSKRMQRFMAGCEHNPESMKGKCPPKAVAEEFSHAPGGTTKGLPERSLRPKGSAPFSDRELTQGYRRLGSGLDD